jgi:DNA replicative helicase MCM subunit Mcm2 (Cdc46/Mcm family)
MHRNKEKAIANKYDAKSIKLFISTAKKLKPMISHEAAQLLRKYYI